MSRPVMVSRFWRVHGAGRQGRRERQYVDILARLRTPPGGSRRRQKCPDYCRMRHLSQLEPLELEHLGALFAEHVADGLRRLVDPRLVDEHLLREEPLVQHSVDDLLTRLLGLGLNLVRVRVDLALGLDDVPGYVLAADPARSR